MRTKSVLFFYLIAVLSGWLPSSTIAAESFNLESKAVHLDDERGSVTIWTLKTGDSHFSFIAPNKWQLNGDADRKAIVMTSPDSVSAIKLQFTNSLPDLKANADLPKLRELVKKRFPEARVLEEFTCHSASGEGTAFDLEMDSKYQSSLRLAFVPIKGAMVEFTLQSSGDQFEAAKHSLAILLNSFQAAKESIPAK